MRIASFVLVLVLLSLLALVLPSASAKGGNLESGQQWLASVAKEDGVVSLPSGLLYRVDVSGSGASPTRESRVKVHYRGTLEDGTEFDSSHSRGQPASFGVTQVIKGWTEALLLMKEGDTWTVWIPSSLAYGSRGAGGAIQADAALKFSIELIEVEGGGKRKGHADLL